MEFNLGSNDALPLGQQPQAKSPGTFPNVGQNQAAMSEALIGGAPDMQPMGGGLAAGPGTAAEPTPAIGPSLGGGEKKSGYGKFGLEGYDAEKMARGHKSPKYMMGEVMSRYDPTGGITPEMMQELNGLGIGSFERLSGDKLRVGGNADPRFEGVTDIDLIRNFTGEGDKAWQFGAEAPGGGGGGQAQGGGVPSMLGGPSGIGGGSIDSALSGDPMQRITQALSKINGEGQVNLDALLQQLQGV